MERRTCIVTGGTSGVGKAIAEGLARAGHEAIILARDQVRGEAAARRLRDSTGNPGVTFAAVDLADPASIRRFAADFSRTHGALHVLSMNATEISARRRETPWGVDSIFGITYVGHFFLAGLLEKALRAGAPSRVVCAVGATATVRRVQPDFERTRRAEGYSYLASTMQAALAKTLFMVELGRRLTGTGVTANAFHPGVVRSSLARGLPWYLRAPASAAMLLAPERCPTGVFACLDPSVAGVTGSFFERGRVVPFRPDYDVDKAARDLWEMSQRLIAGL